MEKEKKHLIVIGNLTHCFQILIARQQLIGKEKYSSHTIFPNNSHYNMNGKFFIECSHWDLRGGGYVQQTADIMGSINTYKSVNSPVVIGYACVDREYIYI